MSIGWRDEAGEWSVGLRHQPQATRVELGEVHPSLSIEISRAATRRCMALVQPVLELLCAYASVDRVIRCLRTSIRS